MIDFHSKAKKLIFLISICVCTTIFSFAQDGKTLFTTRCQVCHDVFKNGTGPALKDLETRGKWADHNEILKWVKDPAAYMAKDSYTQGLKTKYGIVMTPFADLTIKDVDAIVAYINKTAKEGPVKKATVIEKDYSGLNSIIFGFAAIILAIVALVLINVKRGMKQIVSERDGVPYPAKVPCYRNKKFIVLASIILFTVGGYFIVVGAINLGREDKYMPKQPIFYSHKVHAGLNQVNCLYCHSTAMKSKQASVPSVNVCMNCHKAIQTYEKGPQLYDAEGNKIDGNAEIQKLFKYAGFDPNNAAAWDASMAQPIPWIKIHNLPNFVFFSHAQHVKAGQQQCQTCHGEVTAMDEVSQFSDLSMGWCVNCHRTTNVKFNYDSTGNKFYSSYLQFHDAIKKGKVDSITVKDIGGLDCQKCHY